MCQENCGSISHVFLCPCREGSALDRDMAILQAAATVPPQCLQHQPVSEEPHCGTVTSEAEHEVASVLPQVQHQVVPSSSAIHNAATSASTARCRRAAKGGENAAQMWVLCCSSEHFWVALPASAAMHLSGSICHCFICVRPAQPLGSLAKV